MKSSNSKTIQRTFPVRNRHACHPIMRKGGVHEKSQGAKRAAAKQSTRQRVAEWRSRSSLALFKIELLVRKIALLFLIDFLLHNFQSHLVKN